MQNSVPAQRRSWRLKGSFEEYVFIRAFELNEAEAAWGVPIDELQRQLDGWLKFSLGTLRDMLGSVGRLPSSTNPLEEARQLKKLFTEVLQSHRLFAFRREPTQPALGHLIPPTPTTPPDVVDAAELAKEPTPAPQASPARNVNVAQQDSCLSTAAQDGTPFCEVCDNIKRGISS